MNFKIKSTYLQQQKSHNFLLDSFVVNPAGVVSSNTSSPLSVVSPNSGLPLKKEGSHNGYLSSSSHIQPIRG